MELFGGAGTPGSIDGTKSKGWVGGGQLGHNWQYNRVVTGLEIDLSAADIKGTNGGKDMSGPILFTRVYVKKDGRWQAVAFQQTPIVP